MKKLFLLLAMLVALCSGVAGNISGWESVPFIGMPKAYAFETKPVNFVVIDRTGSVGPADMKGWIQMVKMDYHVPYYRLMDDNTKAEAAVREMFAKNAKPDKEAMKAAAEQAGCGALVVMVVHRMESYMVTSHHITVHRSNRKTSSPRVTASPRVSSPCRSAPSSRVPRTRSPGPMTRMRVYRPRRRARRASPAVRS